MPISDKQREFWATKDPTREYDVITFEHSEFPEPVRLVLNEHVPQVFNGMEYIPVAAQLTKPEQGSDPIASATIQFSRIHVGDEFKKYIKMITPFGWAEPIVATIQQYNDKDRDTPSQNWKLYVSEDGVRINRNAIQIKLSDDNPMRANVSTIYTIEEYRGLARV